MLLIRVTEQALAVQYKNQEMRTPVHFGVGQEGPAVGVCAALKLDDVIFTHHRSHNHYLAKGGNLNALVAELHGKDSGCSKGRGGSVHLTDRAVEVVATSAILAQMIPVAVGAALCFKMDTTPRVAVSFFGDGALDEGACYEAFNFAKLHQLPVIFVCENNLYSTETNLDVRKFRDTEYIDRAKAFGLQTVCADGNDVLEVFEKSSKAIESCRRGEGPVFMELSTYRWLEHVGPYYDYEMKRTYRSKEELELWQEKCPIKQLSNYMIQNNVLSSTEQENIRQTIVKKVNTAIEYAKTSAWPKSEEILHNVY